MNRDMQELTAEDRSPGISPIALAGSLAVLLLLLGLGWPVQSWYQDRLIAAEKARADHALQSFGIALDEILYQRLSQLEGLAAFVRIHPGQPYQRDHFLAFADSLRAAKQDIRAIQAFPRKGPVLVTPREGNEATLGRTLDDLINDKRPSVRADVARAIQTQQIVISGPYELRQGGLGLVARLAVFQGTELWGLVVIVLDVPPILEKAGIDPLTNLLDIAMRDRSGDVFFGRPETFAADPVLFDVELPGGRWSITGTPGGGWDSRVRGDMTAFRSTGLVIILLVTLVIFLIGNRQSLLVASVRRRTQALAESRARLHQAVSAGNIGLFDWDLTTDRVSYSREWKRQIGHRQDEISDTPDEWRDRLHPDEKERMLEEVDAFLKNPTRGYRHEFRFRRKDGSYAWIYSQASLIPDAHGEPARILGSHVDITERKEAEEALQLRIDALEHSLNAFDIVDSNGRFVYANQAYLRLWGYDRLEEIIGTSPTGHCADPDTAGRIIEALMQDGKIELEFTARRKDGSTFDAQMSARAFTSAQGETLFMGTSLDVTEAKRAREEIQKLNRELEQRVADRTAQLEETNKELLAFSYSVSHDLRAPLRAIDGFAEMLEEDYGETLNAEAREWLGVIRNRTRDMGQLINDLLSFSRLGRQELTVETVDMADLARQVVSHLKQDEGLDGVEIDIPPLPAAKGDPALIRVVLENLIGNAVKYSSRTQAPAIALHGERKGGTCTYSISDNGIGFDMRHAEKIFEVFHRLEDADDFEGTGIGLALVRRIVARHHGRVWAEAQEEKGATFRFTLPAAR